MDIEYTIRVGQPLAEGAIVFVPFVVRSAAPDKTVVTLDIGGGMTGTLTAPLTAFREIVYSPVKA
jgi:hypothetical protein